MVCRSSYYMVMVRMAVILDRRLTFFSKNYQVIAVDTRGHLNTKGVKSSTQFFIELGYKIAKKLAHKSAKSKQNAEILGLMVNEPNINAKELNQIKMPTLVIAGTKDIIKENHTQEIASNIPNSKLVFISGDHFIAEKQSNAFNQAVDEFLAQM